jgi:hypothetical protein
MKNKRTTDLRFVNILLIFGTTVALLVSTSSSQMISASVEVGIPGPDTSNSNQSAAEGCSPMDPRCNTDVSCGTDPEKCVPPNNSEQSQGGSQETAPGSSSSGASSNPNQQAIDHINQAQSSLQNGDTEGAQRNMDLAKNTLGCTPKWPDPC